MSGWSKMKALSVRQPFAELILQGRKRIELRSWNTKFRGEFCIHAAKAVYKGMEACTGVDCSNVPRGAIVGKATIVAVKEYDSISEYNQDRNKHCSTNYFKGKKIYGFVLESVKRVKPVPCKGRLNFFEVEVK